MRCPLEHNGITQQYGNGHKGIDEGWSKTKTPPVFSSGDGVVSIIEKQKTGGNVIWIYHEKLGVASEYGHLRDGFKVKVGQKVKAGQQIANMGNTGGVYNKKTKKYDPVPYHLHYGIQKGKGGKYGITAKWYNPLDFINVYDDQNTSAKSKKLIHHTKKCIAKDGLNIRNKPSIKGKIVGTIRYGEQVETYGEKNGWNIVDKHLGYYCSNKYLK